MPHLELGGIIPATVTPMNTDHSVDHGALRAYMAWLVGQGVSGLAVNVDTSEGPHLAPEEARAVLETVTAEVNGRVPVVSGLGPAWTEMAIQRAAELKAAGADALLVFPPSAFRGALLPASLPTDYYQRVGEGADVPLILFQLQDALGGVEYPTDVLVEIAKLPHVVAIKEATFDALKFRQTVTALRRSGADIRILTGNDNFIYESFVLGAEGALIGFGTLAVREQVEMVQAHEAGDALRAAELAALFQPLADVIFAPPVRDYRARTKEALRLLGVIPRATLRPPLQPVSEEESQGIAAALQAVGHFRAST